MPEYTVVECATGCADPDQGSRPEVVDGADEIVGRFGPRPVGHLERREIRALARQQPVLVEHPDTASGMRRAGPLRLHRCGDQLGDATGSATSAEEQYTLFADGFTLCPAAGENPGQGHGGRPLNVVVETADLLLVALEEQLRVPEAEVLELDAGVGEDILHCRDELVEESQVLPLRCPGPPKTAVVGVLPDRRVITSDVQGDGDGQSRVHATGGSVEGELSDRDAHAVGAEVTETEDARPISDDDEVGIGPGPVAQDLPQAPPERDRQVHAPRTAQDVAVLLTGPAHCRGVDDRHEPSEVSLQGRIEQALIPFEQTGEQYVPGDVGLTGPQLGQHPVGAVLHRLDSRRQQSVQFPAVTVGVGERGAAVEHRILEPGESRDGAFAGWRSMPFHDPRLRRRRPRSPAAEPLAGNRGSLQSQTARHVRRAGAPVH